MSVTDYCFVFVLVGNGELCSFFLLCNMIASRVVDTDLRGSAPFSFELPFSDPYSHYSVCGSGLASML
jgi:hypothetical protein